MRKNYLCCIRIETELLEKLKKEALENNISLSELCRQKIRENTQLTKMQIMLDQIGKKLNTKLNSNRR